MNIYNLKMKKADFFKNSDKIVGQSIKVIEGYVYFKTDFITKKYLDDNKVKYEIENSIGSRLKRGVFFNLGLIMFFFIFLMLLYIDSYRVSTISFNGEYEINDKIEATIEKKYTHFLSWNYINVNFEALSDELRRDFPSYEWITAYKDGSKIMITINNNQETNATETPGDIVAKKSGTISSFKVYNGIAQIEANQYVKEGDVLISGTVAENNLIEARGLVLGTTFEEINLSIDNEETITEETGKNYDYRLFSIFGKTFSIGKKNKYESYGTKKKLVFNFFNIFKIYKIEEIELYDIIKTYTAKEASEIAKKRILDDFNSTKVAKEEKIERIELLYQEEKDNVYSFRFLTKKIESLGVFKKY